MPSGVRVTRTGRPLARIDALKRRAGVKVEAGMIEAANYLLDVSLQLVPRDTNVLAESGSITQEGSGLDAVILVGYGMFGRPGKVIRGVGNDLVKKGWSDAQGREVTRVPANYAWVQHFNRTFRHPNGGQADYLGEPSRTKVVEMSTAFRRALRGAP